MHLGRSQAIANREMFDPSDLVRAEWTRRSGDRALREYLDQLVSESEIVRSF